MAKDKRPQPVELADVSGLSPAQMAARSPYVKEAHSYVLAQVGNLRDEAMKELLRGMLERPEPLFMESYRKKSQRDKLYAKLTDSGHLERIVPPDKLMPDIEGYLDDLPPIWAAGGSNYWGHHSHPGGLMVHTEGNLRLSLSVAGEYEKMFGCAYDRDTIIFAGAVHDLSKAWVLQWLPDGSCLPQYNIADTGAHHIYGLAESIRRGVPPELLLGQATTHVKPDSRKGRDTLAGFLQAAFLIADEDPVKYGLLDKKGALDLDSGRMEYWLCYLGDHSVVYNVPTARRAVEFLEELAVRGYGFGREDLNGERFNKFRNFVFASCTMNRIYKLLSDGRRGQAEEEIAGLFIK